MRGPAKCLCLVVLITLLGGCTKKVSEENAKKVQPGMTLSEVEAILGSGRKDGADQYEWTTEKGKLRIGFSNNKVTRIENQGAPRVVTEEEQAAEKARSDAKWAEQKKDADRVMQDRDRINALSNVYSLLFAAVGTGDRLPANEAAAAASPLANVNKGMDAIRSGRVVVRWGAAITDDVWGMKRTPPPKAGTPSVRSTTRPRN